MVSRRYELTDEQWNKIKQYFDSRKGRPYKNVRNTVNGIVWILRSGAAWRDLPARYGTWNAVYKCFSTWQETGLFEKIFTNLAPRGIDRQHDNQSSSSGWLQKKESIGKSRGGNTTKIHVAVDALGNPLKIMLTGGQVHDVTVALSLLDELKSDIVMADAAYDSDKLRKQINTQGASACIKPRRNRKVLIPFDKEQYKERHLVECFCYSLR